MDHCIVDPCITFWEFYIGEFICLCLHLPMQSGSPLRSFTVPPLQRDTSLCCFFRLQPAAYIKCLQATQILSSCVSKVKISFLPPLCLFCSPYLTSLLFHAALIDDTAGFRNYTTQHSSMCIFVKHFKAVPRLTFFLTNIRMWF